MKRIILFFLINCFAVNIQGQIHEIGLFLGGTNYVGDIGRENYIYPNDFAVGAFYKYNLNPRIAFKGTFTYGSITSNDADSDNIARNIRAYDFNNSVKELAVGLEFNFFDYIQSSNFNYYTPYLIIELAAVNYNVAEQETSPNRYSYSSKTTFALPIGIGYKTRIAGQLALSIEGKARYLFSDDLDYNNTEIPSLNFGNPDSNDWYFFTGVSLIYTFGREPCYAPM